MPPVPSPAVWAVGSLSRFSMAKGKKRAIKKEQFRQAKAIHGGLIGMLVAAAGVKLSRRRIPTKKLRTKVFRGVFSKKFPPGLNETEADKPIWAYPSLNALFTRGVKPEFRPVATDNAQFLCPCDATVQEIGKVRHGKVLTLKGIEYTLESLLPEMDTAPFQRGSFAILFLSPIDCHRVFSPQDATIDEVVHVPGYRLLVHPPFQKPEYPVYTLNERMIIRLNTALGPCLVVMIAGWGVGNISLPWAKNYRMGRGRRRKRFTRKSWSPTPEVNRGDWLATFELGSTVVLFTPAAAKAKPLVSTNDKVQYGQAIFDCST